MSRRISRAVTALAAVLSLAAIPALADTDHGSMPMTTHPAKKGMSVRVKVSKDRMMGWNLQVRTRAFRWAPGHASSAHRTGEGHAHLFVDGKKVTRLYGPWFFLGELSPGRHKVKVTLNGNDHGDYVRAGKPIAAAVVVTVPSA